MIVRLITGFTQAPPWWLVKLGLEPDTDAAVEERSLASLSNRPVRPIVCTTGWSRVDNSGMTKPRCVLPGVTYLVTRRCSERRFFLRPDPKVTQVFEYLLGWCANKHGIEIHAYVVMTDARGVLPAFTQEFHSLVARAVNHLLGREIQIWAVRDQRLEAARDRRKSRRESKLSAASTPTTASSTQPPQQSDFR